MAQDNYDDPLIEDYNSLSLTISLLRDGKEEKHCVYRDRIFIDIANVTKPIDGLYYFIQAYPVNSGGAQPIWVTFKEAQILKRKLNELREQERIKDLQVNGPKTGSYNDTEVTVTLLRDNKGEDFRFYRTDINRAVTSISEPTFLTQVDSLDSVNLSSGELMQLQARLRELEKEEVAEAMREEQEVDFYYD